MSQKKKKNRGTQAEAHISLQQVDPFVLVDVDSIILA